MRRARIDSLFGLRYSKLSMTPMIDKNNTLATQKRYNRMAAHYDWAELPTEILAIARWRKRLWRQVKGRKILEIGVGTGKSFRFYPPQARIVAIDLSDRMIAVAARKARRQGVVVDLIIADSQALPFKDSAFDGAVASFVFCSVPDPVQGLREVGRVLRPEGNAYLLEHGRSGSPLGWVMDMLNPLVVRMIGANINRRTLDNIRRAGLQIEEAKNLLADVVRLVWVKPTLATEEAIRQQRVGEGRE